MYSDLNSVKQLVHSIEIANYSFILKSSEEDEFSTSAIDRSHKQRNSYTSF